MIYIFPFDETSIPVWMYFAFFFINIGVYLFWRKQIIEIGHSIVTFRDYIVLFLFVVFTIFYCLDHDYFAYREWVGGGLSAYYTKETIYTYLTSWVISINTSYNYELFRFLIWGISVILVYFITIIIKQRPLFVLLFIFLLFNTTFSYGRGTLGMAIYSLGLILIIKGGKKIKYNIIGLVIAMISVFFHRQMFIALAVMPILFFPIKFNNVILLIFPLITIALIGIWVFMENSWLLSDSMTDSFDNYKNIKDNSLTINRFIGYSIFYFSFILITNLMTRIKQNVDTVYIFKLYRIVFGLIVVATAFFIFFGNNAFFYRTLYMSMIPISIILSYFYENKLVKKSTISRLFIYAILFHSIRLIVLLR